MTIGYSDLYSEVSYFLGLTSRPTAPTSDNLTTCKAIVHRGIRQFLYPIDERGQPHEWEFLKQAWSIKTENGKWKVPLPIDFSEMCGTLHYDSNSVNAPLSKCGAEQILSMRSGLATTGEPEFFAITPSKYSGEVGTLYEMWFYPTPQQTDTLYGFYRADPVQLSATTDLVIGGVRAIEAILESCLAVAELQEDDMASSHHTAKAAELILKLIKFDKVTSSDKIGNLYRNLEADISPRGYFTNPSMDNVYP